MTIRLAVRNLRTQFETYTEIIYYDLVKRNRSRSSWAMSPVRRTYFAVFILIASARTHQQQQKRDRLDRLDRLERLDRLGRLGRLARLDR